VGRDLQLKASYASSPPCTCLLVTHSTFVYRVTETHRIPHLDRSFSSKEPYNQWLFWKETYDLRHPMHSIGCLILIGHCPLLSIHISFEHPYLLWASISLLSIHISFEHPYLFWASIFPLSIHISFEHPYLLWASISLLSIHISFEHPYLFWASISLLSIHISFEYSKEPYANHKRDLCKNYQ